MGKIALALAVTMLMSGCATVPRLTGSLCTAGPFIPDKGASTRWTRSEKEQLVTLNESGAKVCGWKAP